jgi:cell pole-organizing protein PopZ
MSPSDGSRRPGNDSAESFICKNLSIFQANWLQRQSEALEETRSEMLEAIMAEWFELNPPAVWEEMDEVEIARRAVEEFILHHHEEFL